MLSKTIFFVASSLTKKSSLGVGGFEVVHYDFFDLVLFHLDSYGLSIVGINYPGLIFLLTETLRVFFVAA